MLPPPPLLYFLSGVDGFHVQGTAVHHWRDGRRAHGLGRALASYMFDWDI